MAHVALRTIPPAMNIGVAILAVRADVGEHRIDMAFLAGNGGMQSSQWEAGLIVVKFGLPS